MTLVNGTNAYIGFSAGGGGNVGYTDFFDIVYAGCFSTSLSFAIQSSLLCLDCIGAPLTSSSQCIDGYWADNSSIVLNETGLPLF